MAWCALSPPPPTLDGATNTFSSLPPEPEALRGTWEQNKQILILLERRGFLNQSDEAIEGMRMLKVNGK